MNNSNETIKQNILSLSKQHHALGELDEDLLDYNEAEIIEQNAIGLIIDYCVKQAYFINGLPNADWRKTDEDVFEHEVQQEKLQLYLDTLTLQKDDVADLTWTFVASFWPGEFENKESYLEHIKERLDSTGFYSVTL
jgi:hypothetical protein